MTTLNENRQEILFIYDASYCNPNGDPADENKPRFDSESQVNLVSDVRLKRTVRDYLREIKNLEIFVHAPPDEMGNVPDAKERARQFTSEMTDPELTKENLGELDTIILKRCIDRLFGATIPVELKGKKNDSIVHTGPVQFKIGQSLHKVAIERIKGTGAFASKSEAS